MRNRKRLRILYVVLGILFWPIFLIRWLWNMSVSSGSKKQNDEDILEMDEIIDIEELMEE